MASRLIIRGGKVVIPSGNQAVVGCDCDPCNDPPVVCVPLANAIPSIGPATDFSVFRVEDQGQGTITFDANDVTFTNPFANMSNGGSVSNIGTNAVYPVQSEQGFGGFVCSGTLVLNTAAPLFPNDVSRVRLVGNMNVGINGGADIGLRRIIGGYQTTFGTQTPFGPLVGPVVAVSIQMTLSPDRTSATTLVFIDGIQRLQITTPQPNGQPAPLCPGGGISLVGYNVHTGNPPSGVVGQVLGWTFNIIPV